MTTVNLDNTLANDAMDIVRELRAQGYAQGQDYDFAWHQTQYDPVNGHHIQNSYTEFKFYNDALASWFSLRYKK